MRKNKEEKYTLTIRMDSKTEQEIREKMDDAPVSYTHLRAHET